VLLMDSSISSKWNVSASQATFFEMLSAWSASFLADMTRISRGMNHRACKEGRPCQQMLEELQARKSWALVVGWIEGWVIRCDSRDSGVGE
jgi:hypothetical protein